jgi:hypothetical protein
VPRWVYRETKGKLETIKTSERPPLKGVPPEAAMGFHDAVLKAYQHLEDTGNWQGAYASKSEIKRIHEQARARGG